MLEKFMLKKASEIASEVLKKNYFMRYDLTDECKWYNNLIKNLKLKKKRPPFFYDIIDEFLNPTEPIIIKTVKNILLDKDIHWFNNIGQYFFYNLFQWLYSKDYINTNYPLNRKSFLNNWWNFFCEYENKLIDSNVQNKNKPFPDKILLELTNNCNLNCIMCGVGKYGYNPVKNLSLDLLKYLCDKVLCKVKLIRLNGLGESTIIPNFLEYLELLTKLPAKLEIVTNLTVQKIKIWDALIRNGTFFLISCDSANPHNYERIRKGASFLSFKNNLIYLGKNISQHSQAQIIFTLMEQNIDDLLDVIDLASICGIGGIIVNGVKYKETSSWIEKNLEKIKDIFKKSYDKAQNLGISIKLPDHLGNFMIDSSISTKSCKDICNNPCSEIYVRYNGDLTICNMLNPYICGNCKNYPFEEIWNGLNANIFRNFINTKYRHYYCRECYYLT